MSDPSSDCGSPFPARLRVVEVVADLGGERKKRWRYGSGLFLTTGLVVTAAHLLENATAARVRGVDKKTYEVDLRKSLVSPPGQIDIALLAVHDGPAVPLLPINVVDRDVSIEGHVVECWSVGYPAFQEAAYGDDGESLSDTAQVSGRIPPLSGLHTGLLSFEVDKLPRALPRNLIGEDGSPWSGMSGAAVMAGGALIGVISEHTRARGLAELTVAPVSALTDPRLSPKNASEWLRRLRAAGSDPAGWERIPRRPGPPDHEDQFVRRGAFDFPMTGVIGLPHAPPGLIPLEAVDSVAAIFAAGGRVAVLTGGPGAGKTQVAAEYARNAADDAGSRVWWVSADSPATMLSGLAGIAERLDVADPSGDSQRSADRLRDALATLNVPVVLVLDNPDDPQLTRRCIPGRGQARVIITSTDRAFASLGDEVEVSGFKGPQAVEYLCERTGLPDTGGRAAAVAVELGYLPLAIAQAATAIPLLGLSYDAYLDRLRSLPLERTVPVDPGDPYPRSVAGALLLGIEAVEHSRRLPILTHVLEAVSLLASSGAERIVLNEILCSETGDVHKLDEAIGTLVRASLLVWTDDRRTVVMHRLLARVIRDRLEKRGELAVTARDVATGLKAMIFDESEAWQRREAGASIVRHVSQIWQITAAGNDRDLLPVDELRKHLELVHWAIRHQLSAADADSAMRLARIAVDDCRRCLDPEDADTLQTCHLLAMALEEAGDYPSAIAVAKDTLKAREELLSDDDESLMDSRSLLAYIYESDRQPERAIPLYKSILREREHRHGLHDRDTLVIRNNLATALEDAGHLQEALDLHEELLAHRRTHLGPADRDTLISANNLAHGYNSVGREHEAAGLYEESLVAWEQAFAPDDPGSLTARNGLGITLCQLGRHEHGLQLLRENVALCGQLDPGGLMTFRVRRSLAKGLVQSGSFDEAIQTLEDALEARLNRLRTNSHETRAARSELASAYVASGQPSRAIPLLQQIVDERTRLLGEDHEDTANARRELADARSNLKDSGQPDA